MMTETQRAAMQAAHDALAKIKCDSLYEQDCTICSAEETLRAALAEPEPAEKPAGYWDGKFYDGGSALYEAPQKSLFGIKYTNIPLYTRPQRRDPLTDDQIMQLAATPCAVPGSYAHTLARAIESAHGIGAKP